MRWKTHSPGVRVVLRDWRAQQSVIKGIDLGALADEVKSTVGPGSHEGVLVDVASQTTRVQARAVGLGVLGNRSAGCRHRRGPEVDDHAVSSCQRVCLSFSMLYMPSDDGL
jgi:hypothetical protein